MSTPVEVVALHVSGAHAYEGRPADGPRPDPAPVARDHVAVRAGLGLLGDRYFNHPGAAGRRRAQAGSGHPDRLVRRRVTR